MSGTQGSVQTAAEVRSRAERFASLRAAQRALSHSVHPSELARANAQARELVIRLQALSARVRGGPGDAGTPVDAEELAHIDGLLDATSARLYEILDRIEIAWLRSTIPPLLAEHPEDVRGLVEVLAEGALDANDELRKLEYLVTMLCSDERNGHRVVVREPADLSPRLRKAARRRAADETRAADVERRLGDAIAQLLHGSADVGSVRDEIRQLKEQMGALLLQPRVLASVVAYNVAMANQVAGLVHGSRSIDRLAEDLMAGVDAGAAGAPQPPRDPNLPTTDLLGSSAFEALVAAFRARITGRGAGAGEARRVAEACSVEGLIPMELEAFEEGEEDRVARLTRAAVVVGLVSRQVETLDAPLRALGVDPELLATDGVAAVNQEMTGVARKLFADSEYDAAFRISEIKTRNLARVASGRSAGPRAATPRPAPSEAATQVTPASSGPFELWGFSARQLLAGALAAAALLAAALWLPSGWSGAIYPAEELAKVSPFLASGYRDEVEGQPIFVGRLHPTWGFLGTPERREVATYIGTRFQAGGIPSVALSDNLRRPQAEWRDGELRFLAPRP